MLDFFLRHLDPRWEIYIQPHLNGLRPDFVRLNPRIGIAVFEVKNWDLAAMQYWVDSSRMPPTLMGNNGQRDFSLAASDPVSKIHFYKEMIEALFCPRMNTTASKALITAGIIFPSATTAQTEALLSPLLQRFRMRTEKTAPYYPVSGEDVIETGDLRVVFPESQRRSSSHMQPEYAQDLRDWLVEPSIAAEQREPLPLDARQQELATTRTQNGYRRIRGPAGSGKSLVLAARAGQLVAEGKDVLVMSFNITLLHYLQDLAVRWPAGARGARAKATWWNFHLWCKSVCFQAGASDEYRKRWKGLIQASETLNKTEQNARLDQFLSEELPRFVADTLDRHRGCVLTYDAVLVDEGQDFYPAWWNLLRRVCRADGEMLLVADATQDIYGTAGKWTDEAMLGAGFRGGWNVLPDCYRLPNAFIPFVRDYASRYVLNALLNLPEPRAELPHVYPCTQRWVQVRGGNVPHVCCEEILRLLKREGDSSLSVADVVFLAPRIADGRIVVEELRETYKYSFAHTFSTDKTECRRLKHGFFLGDARLKATTLHSFKGYEGRALVILIDRNPLQPMHELLYVGLTRLREDSRGSFITVVCADPELESYGRSWPVYQENPGPEEPRPLRRLAVAS